MFIKSSLSLITSRQKAGGVFSAFLMLIAGSQAVFAASNAPKSFVRKAVVATDLPLYRLLHCIDSNIKTQLRDAMEAEGSQDDESQKTLLSALSLSETGLELVTSIVDDFNNGTAPLNREIEHKFMKICMLNKDVESGSTKQRHLRELIKHIKSFNHYITVFCLNRKNFLKPSDKDFFNRVTQLNHILLYGVLNEDYIDINLLDRAADLLVYRPLEFMAQHKVITAIVITAIVVCLGYYWWTYQSPYKEFVLQDGTVIKYLDCPQQKYADCGYYALMHAIIMDFAGSEEEVKEYIARAKKHPEMIDIVKTHMKNTKKVALCKYVNEHKEDLKPLATVAGNTQLATPGFTKVLTKINGDESLTPDEITDEDIGNFFTTAKTINNYALVKGKEKKYKNPQAILEVTSKIGINQVNPVNSQVVELNKHKIDSNWIHGNQFEEFLNDPALKGKIKNELAKDDPKEDEIGTFKISNKPVDEQNVFMLEEPGDENNNGRGFNVFQEENQQFLAGQYEPLSKKVDEFRKDQKQHMTIVIQQPGHWTTVRLQKKKNEKGENVIVPLVADSMGAGKRRSPASGVVQIIDIFKNRKLPVWDEDYLEKKSKVENATGKVEQINNTEVQDPVEMAKRGWRDFAQACQEELLINQHLANNKLFKDCFERMRNACFGQYHDVGVNIDEKTSFETYLNQLN